MRTTRAGLIALAMAVLGSAALAGNDPKSPNILIILTDDVGWAEFGFQGCKDIPTPHIDTIAQGGMRFTQGYVSGPYCSPTRAGLMTGRYQTRFGHEFNSVARNMGLPLTETTIAQRLKERGYATAAVGKWHLGSNPEYQPLQRGFGEFYGTLANTPFYHPAAFMDSLRSDEIIAIEDDDFYTTNQYGARASDWIERHKDEPWFLYLPFNAQHAPLQAPEEYLAKFPNIEDPKRKIFAGMMAAMDDAVGRVLETIRKVGQEENTLIFFLSDNGGPTQSTTSSNLPLNGFKATTWEGGVRVPFAVQWKGTLPAGAVYDKPIIQLDILPTALAAAGVEASPDWKLDGVNLLPYLKGERDGKPHETLYWRFGEQRAIRHGDWKLVVARGGSGQPELYNLADDLGEQHNLMSAQPEKARELQQMWAAWNAEQAPALVPDQPAGGAARRQAAGVGGPAMKKGAAAKKGTPKKAARKAPAGADGS